MRLHAPFGFTARILLAALAFAVFFVSGTSCLADSSKLEASFSGDFSGRIGEHLYSPIDLATQKLLLELNESVKYEKWSGNFGFRGWDEGAYASNTTRYPPPVVQYDSKDLRVRDFYIQYHDDGLTIRLGSQQVVWGEAFGFFYSDIVNPKDLRDGAFGGLADTRLQTPIANIKWVLGDFSIQGIFIPVAFTDIVPEPGSDFLFPYGSNSPFSSITVNRQESLPINAQNVEGGGRVSYLFGNLDVSAFYLYYFDRMPSYTIDPASTQTNIIADEQHSRIQSGGVTATMELDSLLLRFEGLGSFGRQLPSLLTPTVDNPTGLSVTQTDQYLYVVGVDFPTWEQVNIGLQWSQDVLTTNANYLSRNPVADLISVHLQRPVFLKQSIQAVYAYETSDGGSRLEAAYNVPLSGSVETEWGVNWLTGPPTSDFGRIQQGSRAYVLLKCFFKG